MGNEIGGVGKVSDGHPSAGFSSQFGKAGEYRFPVRSMTSFVSSRWLSRCYQDKNPHRRGV
jgi:hypothetical protein